MTGNPPKNALQIPLLICLCTNFPDSQPKGLVRGADTLQGLRLCVTKETKACPGLRCERPDSARYQKGRGISKGSNQKVSLLLDSKKSCLLFTPCGL